MILFSNLRQVWTDSDTGDQSKHGRAENIIDGVMRTRDERHAWTVPAPRGNPIALSVLLAGSARLALLRIWVSGGQKRKQRRFHCDSLNFACGSYS